MYVVAVIDEAFPIGTVNDTDDGGGVIAAAAVDKMWLLSLELIAVLLIPIPGA